MERIICYKKNQKTKSFVCKTLLWILFHSGIILKKQTCILQLFGESDCLPMQTLEASVPVANGKNVIIDFIEYFMT